MYCTNCGTELPHRASACGHCSTPVPYFPPPPVVPNYLVHSLLATLCCCLPFGIVALIYSVQVNSKIAAGDEAGAQAASASAKTWVIVAVIAGVVSIGGLGALSSFQ